MPGTAVGLFIIDFVIRPFARVLEKWPMTMLVLLLVLYSIVAYIVIRSAYMPDHQQT